MSTIPINSPLLEAISQRRTRLLCFELNECSRSIQTRALAHCVSQDPDSARSHSRMAFCKEFCGYEADVFYANAEDQYRRPHDTEETRIPGFSPEKLREDSDESLGQGGLHLRLHWPSLAPLFEQKATLIAGKGINRMRDSHENAIENLSQCADESAMVDELDDGTSFHIMVKTSVYNGTSQSGGWVFLMHKTPTECVLARCFLDGYVLHSCLFTRTSPTQPWTSHADVRIPSDKQQQHLDASRQFYGIFRSLQLMEDDFQSFSHTIAPGSCYKNGLDKYVNYAKFPFRMFFGY